MLDDYLDLLDMCYEELAIAFEGLADQNVWKRPADGLLSIGEIAGHVAHWDAVRLAGGGDKWPDLAQCRVKSPLIHERFQYYTKSIEVPPSAEHLAMSADQVCKELLRIHRESVAQLRANNPELDAAPPGWPQGGPAGNTLRDFLKYLVFHVGYHTGQIYSARYLLGETPPDN